ncbi:MAG: phosphotransferase [Clostridia bacterium]|nr:phosphotransferase [Clostridia bacterium]
MKQVFKPLELGDQKPFAMGGTGECYRLNEDTILKLYYESFPTSRILREKEGARTALVAGIPTAISFDMVQVGNRRGVIYELIQGKTLSEIIAQTPERVSELGRMLAEIAATLHNAAVEKKDLPNSTGPIRMELQKVDYASEATVQRISDFLDTLDLEQHYVHGDFHPNNIIITADGPMLIDMDGFSLGCPMFDLATLRFSLFESPEAVKGGRNSFNGLTHEEALDFWQSFADTYFDGNMSADSTELLKKVMIIKKMHFERLYGQYFPAKYCEAVRNEVLSVFGDQQECFLK